MKVRLLNQKGEFIEAIDTKFAGQKFILYRGRLFELANDERVYIQRQYVEIY